MNRPLSALLGAAALAAGCSNNATPAPMPDAGPPITASINGVFPQSVFLGRTRDVVISGFDTHFTDMTAVDFGGADVKVVKVAAASPTALNVTLAVDAKAKTGPRDVTVTDAGAMLKYVGAFSIDSPLGVTVQGTAAQGSIFSLKLVNKDFENPFDTTSTGGGLFGGPTMYTNLAIPVPAGVSLTIDSATAYEIDGTALVDVDAMPAAVDLDVQSGPAGGLVHFSAPAALTLTARGPTPLMPGVAATGMESKPFDSALYAFDGGSGVQIVDFSTTSPSMTAMPALALLAGTGHFADLINFGPVGTVLSMGEATHFYAVYWDNSGAAAYSYSVLATPTAANPVKDAEPNNDPMHANALGALPAAVTDGNFENRGELLLDHRHEGIDLRIDYAKDTLKNLFAIWTRPVHLRTLVEGKGKLFTYDGEKHVERKLDG